MYYIAQVNFETIDERNGKTKNITEEYLVSGTNVSDVESKLKDKFGEGMSEFRVKTVKESKILGIIE